MLKEERFNFILNEVRVRNRVLLSDIAIKLNVSEDTIRRDFNQLQEDGKVKRVHGGAISNSFHLFKYSEAEIYAHEDKSIIARKIHKLLKNETVIIMSGGTTNLEVAKHLPEDFHGTICTPSLPVAMQLSENANIEAILIGGKLLSESQIALGGDAINRINEIQADLCLLGTGHLDPTYGFSEIDWEVVQLKKAIIKSSKKVVALSISEKLNSIQRFKVCNTQDIHCLVTELNPDDPTLDSYRNLGLELI